MNPATCPECGAVYADPGDSCAARFDALLALDHSRQEPWGSRHGQAFAAFALQHPMAYASSLDHAWAALHRIYVAGEKPATVFRALVAGRGIAPPAWRTPPRPAQRIGVSAITIAHLDDFTEATYPERLEAWCRASLAAWGAAHAS